MGSVDHDHVDASRLKGFGALGDIGDTDRSGDSKPPIRIEGRVGVFDALVDVLDRDQALEQAGVVDQRQLLDAMLVQHCDRFLEAGTDGCGDQTIGGHEIGDGLRVLIRGAEPHIAVGEDADKTTIGITDRHTADLVPRHQRLGIVECGRGREADRRRDHAGLGPLDPIDLLGLLLDGEVAVQHPDPAGSSDSDRQRRFGDRVHRRRHQRHGQLDPRQRRGGVDFGGQDFAPTGDDQHVVEGERLGTGEHLVVHRLTIGEIAPMTRTRDRGYRRAAPLACSTCHKARQASSRAQDDRYRMGSARQWRSAL